MNVQRLGWGDDFASAFEEHSRRGLHPGRIAVEHRGAYVIYTGDGEVWGEPAGKLRYMAEAGGDMPAVGDWVACRPRPGEDWVTIEAVLPRRTKFSRKEAGFRTVEQVMAANVDVALIVTAMTGEAKGRRIERYLTMAWEGGTSPVVVLTKADLCDDPGEVVAELETVTLGVPVLVTSVVTGRGLDLVSEHIGVGRTAVTLGSSGVGKSSLINALLGEGRQEVRELRGDGIRGKHTTTRRELIELPQGGVIIDTPGIRELQLWDGDEGLDSAFEDIAALEGECRFSDCTHRSEPGCAVLAAIEDGTLDRSRLDSRRKLERELQHLENRQDKRVAANAKRRWKAIAKAHRANPKDRW